MAQGVSSSVFKERVEMECGSGERSLRVSVRLVVALILVHIFAWGRSRRL